MTTTQPITISEEAKELAGEIWDFYGNAPDHECTCYAKPESSCAYCNAWTRARALSELSIQEFYNSSREQDKKRIEELEHWKAESHKALKAYESQVMSLEKQILELRELQSNAVRTLTDLASLSNVNTETKRLLLAIAERLREALTDAQCELENSK